MLWQGWSVGRVSLSLWHSASGRDPVFRGRFLVRDRKVRLLGSSAKQPVMPALDFETPPKRKESQHTVGLPLTAYVIISLICVFSCLSVQLHRTVPKPQRNSCLLFKRTSETDLHSCTKHIGECWSDPKKFHQILLMKSL